MNLKKLKIADHEIDYYFLPSRAKKAAKKILFLHGYGSLPHFYQQILTTLAGQCDVYAPVLYGINYLPRPVVEFEEYMKLTREFIDKMSLQSSVSIGHSYGGTIAFFLGAEKLSGEVISINPMFHQPIDFIRIGKLLAEAVTDLNNKLGETHSLAKNPDISSRYVYNLLKNPVAYVSGALSATKERLPDVTRDIPVTLVQANRDSMFSFDRKVEEELRSVFPALQVELLNNYSHNWLLYHPELASDKILKVLHG